MTNSVQGVILGESTTSPPTMFLSRLEIDIIKYALAYTMLQAYGQQEDADETMENLLEDLSPTEFRIAAEQLIDKFEKPQLLMFKPNTLLS